MRFLTDRKRAQGMGASGGGTDHHWQMLVSSIYLVPLVPIFIFTFGVGLGGTHEEVVAYFSRPFPAIATALSMIVIIWHVMNEVNEALEDYVHGVAGKLSLIASKGFAYVLIAATLYALVTLAL